MHNHLYHQNLQGLLGLWLLIYSLALTAMNDCHGLSILSIHYVEDQRLIRDSQAYDRFLSCTGLQWSIYRHTIPLHPLSHSLAPQSSSENLLRALRQLLLLHTQAHSDCTFGPIRYTRQRARCCQCVFYRFEFTANQEWYRWKK